MIFVENRPFFGVIFLRPGDDPPDVVIEGLPRLVDAEVSWTPPSLRMRRPGGAT